MGYLQQKLQMLILQGVLPDLPCLQHQSEVQNRGIELSKSQEVGHPGVFEVPSNAKHSAPHYTLACKRIYTASNQQKRVSCQTHGLEQSHASQQQFGTQYPSVWKHTCTYFMRTSFCILHSAVSVSLPDCLYHTNMVAASHKHARLLLLLKQSLSSPTVEAGFA